MACWNPSTSHTNRGLQQQPVGIPLPHIPIEDYKNDLLGSLYLTYRYLQRTSRIACWNPATLYTNRGLPSVACWNPSTSDTNRGLPEWPVGIPLPYKNIHTFVPIWDYKSCLLESLYVKYQQKSPRVTCWNSSTTPTSITNRTWVQLYYTQ